jgi:hypothetical protein
MTTEQKIVQLKRWEAAYRALQKNYDSFCQLTESKCDSPLWGPIWHMFELYTDSLAKLVNDDSHWLDWYCWECGMGSSPMAAILGEDRLYVDSLDKLLLCIEHDGKEARNGRA